MVCGLPKVTNSDRNSEVSKTLCRISVKLI